MTSNDVIDIIKNALRRSNDIAINDVTEDQALDSDVREIILTTDDVDGKMQKWVLAANAIVETDLY